MAESKEVNEKMKKSTKRTAAAMLAAIMMISLIASCNQRGNEDENQDPSGSSEYVYIAEITKLPEEMDSVTNLTPVGDMLVFASSQTSEDGQTTTVKLYSLGFDGTEPKELENYEPAEKPSDLPENAESSYNILGIIPDSDGNIWVAERGNFHYFDLPADFSVEDSDMYGMYAYYRDLGSTMVMRLLDSTGEELRSIDLSGISNNGAPAYINAVNMDQEGNIYLGFNQTICVIDNTGTESFRLEVQNWVDTLMSMSDGSIAFSGYVGSGRVLQKIDTANKDWGEEQTLPMLAQSVYHGGGIYDIVYADSDNIFGIDPETGESVPILNLINCGIGGGTTVDLFLLPDHSVVLNTFNLSWSRTNQITGTQNEIVLLKSVPADSVPPRTVLTLGCNGVDWNLRNVIVDFNRTNTQYRIEVIDYSVYGTEDDRNAGITKLSTEIISGNVPDILITTSLPFSQYIAKGMIEDLYPFIDSDPELGREALVEGALKAAEVSGSLYQVFPTFYIYTMWGNPAVLGAEPSWTMDEFLEIIDNNPQATYPIGYYVTKDTFLLQTVMLGMDRFVDWAEGTTNFDSEEFIKILEFTNTIPSEVEINYETYVRPEELIDSGEQIIQYGGVSDLVSTLRTKALFGGDLVYKGFPSESQPGNVLVVQGSLAMTTACKDKEGAWQFLRKLLTADFQSPIQRLSGLPVNKANFDSLLSDVMTQEYITDMDGNEIPVPKLAFWITGSYTLFTAESYAEQIEGTGMYAMFGSRADDMIYVYAMTQEQADQILELLDNVSGIEGGYDEGLINIIIEGAQSYFDGMGTAEDAARIIQGKAMLLVSEQS